MIIVVDGVNRSGKTTLIKSLSGILSIPVVSIYSRNNPSSLFCIKDELLKSGATTNDFFEDIVVTEMVDQIGANKIDFIVDRFFLSAMSYRIMRMGSVGIEEGIVNWWFS